jgi:hypothetical protein
MAQQQRGEREARSGHDGDHHDLQQHRLGG